MSRPRERAALSSSSSGPRRMPSSTPSRSACAAPRAMVNTAQSPHGVAPHLQQHAHEAGVDACGVPGQCHTLALPTTNGAARVTAHDHSKRAHRASLKSSTAAMRVTAIGAGREAPRARRPAGGGRDPNAPTTSTPSHSLPTPSAAHTPPVLSCDTCGAEPTTTCDANARCGLADAPARGTRLLECADHGR